MNEQIAANSERAGKPGDQRRNSMSPEPLDNADEFNPSVIELLRMLKALHTIWNDLREGPDDETSSGLGQIEMMLYAKLSKTPARQIGEAAAKLAHLIDQADECDISGTPMLFDVLKSIRADFAHFDETFPRHSAKGPPGRSISAVEYLWDERMELALKYEAAEAYAGSMVPGNERGEWSEMNERAQTMHDELAAHDGRLMESPITSAHDLALKARVVRLTYGPDSYKDAFVDRLTNDVIALSAPAPRRPDDAARGRPEPAVQAAEPAPAATSGS